MHKFALQPLLHPSSKILILGTMPGEQSIARQQYYGNKGNHFWKIIFTLFDKNFSDDYQERKELLKENNIALWNVLASCVREGSSDSKIKNETANDFKKMHIEYPNISHIFFESKTAAKFFYKYSTAYEGITYHLLPSTSGLNAGLSLAQKIELWKELAHTVKKLKQ